MNDKQWLPGSKGAFCLGVLLALQGCAAKKPAELPSWALPSSMESKVIEEPADARAILGRMADFLSKTPQFSVSVDDNYDVLQPSGQMIEFGESRNILLRRPGELRAEFEANDGDKHLLIYNGKDITLYNYGQNVYARINKPGGIDEAVIFFLKNLRMRLPLAALLLSRLPQELERRTETLDYVERMTMEGTPTHHLAGRTDTVDYQIWVKAGAEPLPLRVVLTYRNAEGHPQFRAQLSNWNLAPIIDSTQFTFNPPAGARKIVFAAELLPGDVSGASSSKLKGDRK